MDKVEMLRRMAKLNRQGAVDATEKAMSFDISSPFRKFWENTSIRNQIEADRLDAEVKKIKGKK